MGDFGLAGDRVVGGDYLDRLERAGKMDPWSPSPSWLGRREPNRYMVGLHDRGRRIHLNVGDRLTVVFGVVVGDVERFDRPATLRFMSLSCGIGADTNTYEALEECVVKPEDHFYLLNAREAQRVFDEYVADVAEFIEYRNGLNERYGTYG